MFEHDKLRYIVASNRLLRHLSCRDIKIKGETGVNCQGSGQDSQALTALALCEGSAPLFECGGYECTHQLLQRCPPLVWLIRHLGRVNLTPYLDRTYQWRWPGASEQLQANRLARHIVFILIWVVWFVHNSVVGVGICQQIGCAGRSGVCVCVCVCVYTLGAFCV